jgi:hypothetical protein
LQRDFTDELEDQKNFLKMLHFQKRLDQDFNFINFYGIIISDIEYCGLHSMNMLTRNCILNVNFFGFFLLELQDQLIKKSKFVTNSKNSIEVTKEILKNSQSNYNLHKYLKYVPNSFVQIRNPYAMDVYWTFPLQEVIRDLFVIVGEIFYLIRQRNFSLVIIIFLKENLF